METVVEWWSGGVIRLLGILASCWYESSMGDATPVSGPPNSGAASPTPSDRRPIRTRDARWVKSVASSLARGGVSPNQISLMSILAAGVGAASLVFLSQPWNAIGCVCGVQIRLLCNLLDGMVAIEHGKQTPLGALYNELPDRVSDSVLFIALGYAAGIPWLGWLTALVGGTDGLHPGLRRSAWICSGFSRPDGQAAPDGGLNSRLSALRSSSILPLGPIIVCQWHVH